MTHPPPCPHGIDPATCPACAQEEYDAHAAVRLAASDPETVDGWRRDFEAWVGGEDSMRCYWGDILPSVAPGVVL